ncbi:cGMP-specific 3',5'-cyclic phosphodiesterase-like, partial [Ostrinia furnacalis]|uniref:cGMP-specific 3',5'-cyclic phosphodiesterase-like n=1 Tax=Ostrinia furnacalis TaxID=93504 RepID=UPI00103C247C
LKEALQTARTQEIRIPFGVGVAGLAAQTKHPINIKNAYADPRFNSEIDARTGYKTELILCMPICNYEGEVVGVAQIINKTDGSKEFSPRDVEVFRRYLTFCGIGIQNAQLFESSILEYKRNQILLALARSIFEEQSNLECLVTKIMTEARELLKCDRCAVFILDTDHCESSHLERIVQRPGGRPSTTLALPPPAPTRFHTLFELGAQQSRTTLTPRHDYRSTLASIALKKNSHALTGAGFNSEIDARTGYKTELILCMPICNYEGEVVGVAQIINKTDGSKEFSPRDVEVFRRYLTFCGIGIQNAQLFESSILEYKRNQILLALARSIFEEQSNLECLVTKIMTEARELLKCDRCAVFILDTDHCESSHLERIVQRPGGRPSTTLALPPPAPTRFHTLFELGAQQSRTTLTPRHDYRSTLASIALKVAQSNKSLNITDLADWRKENKMTASDPAADDAAEVRTMLCMPIVNANKDVIGVAQLINKENGSQFSDGDISIFEAFAIFCGLGIHNTQMYENACKLMAKQKVALECLSYHATASTEDTTKLCQDIIPSAEIYNLYSFQFHDFDLSDEDTCRATLRMFLQCNLVEKFHIPYDVLCRWILSVKKNYRPVKYHNWRHALNVAQTMFAMLKTGKMERFMSDLEILGLLVACLCHDLDHRGTNNAFQTKTESPLAILYTTSTMEHHHFDQCVMILNSESNNIFQALSPDDYKDVMRVVETAILSTDLAMYFKKKSKFLELVDNGEFDWQSQEKKELLCGMMMTACDVSAIAKPWEVQHKVAKLVADEFFDQGDLEKLQLNQQPIAMMDREKKDELPQMQVGFIDMICLPLYKVLSDTFPWIQPLYTGTMDNRQRWQDLAEKVEMGLTWIDHDTIDKPIEEFTASNEPIKDVELTVTTLNCAKTAAESSMALVKPIKTPFHSLRRGKSGNFTSRPARSKLTRSLYVVPSSQREGERERPIVKKPPSAESNHTSGETETKTKHKGRLCHML